MKSDRSRFPGILTVFFLAGLSINFAGNGMAHLSHCLEELSDGLGLWFDCRPFSLIVMALAAPVAAALLLTPGMIAAHLLVPKLDDLGLWCGFGLVLSWGGLAFLVPVIESITGLHLQGVVLAGTLALTSLVLLIVTNLRGGIPGLAARLSSHRNSLICLAALSIAAALLLGPKLYFEDLNGDGAQILIGALWLIETGNPFLPNDAGYLSGYPSMSTLLEIYTASWHVRLFGASEAGVRFAGLTGMILLGALTLDLIRHDRTSLSWVARLTVLCALLVFYWTLSWNASYNPYFSDMASPTLREPYVACLVLAVIRASLARHLWLTWILMCALMLASPGGPAVIGFWLAAHLVAGRPWPWRWFFVHLALLVCAAMTTKLSHIGLVSLDLAPVTDEFSGMNIAERLRFFAPAEFHRLLLIAVPCGLVPVAALLALPANDRIGRAIALCAIAYGAFFYFQAYRVLLHHFAPVSALALVSFWRIRWCEKYDRATSAICAVGIVAALWISSPPAPAIHNETRSLGRQIAYESASTDLLDMPRLRAFHDLFLDAIPMDFSEHGWKESFFVSPLPLRLYATTETHATTLFRVRDADAPAPGPGWHETGRSDLLRLYTRDELTPEIVAHHVPSTISPALFLSRRSVFARGARAGPRPIWDLAVLAGLR